MNCVQETKTSTGDSPRKFTYDALNNANAQLRLLSIEPGEWSAPLKATLFTFDRSTAPQYAAISYTWGDPTPVQPISINGTAYDVRFNCYYALVQARYHKKRSHLWIDSICINQDDVAEKSAQVAHMDETFSSAHAVYFCVGAHDGDSLWLCQKFKRFQTYCTASHIDLPFKELSGRLIEEGEELWDTFKESILNTDPNLRRFAAAYNEFCDRPYWNRLWTLQEIVLARHGRVWCGRSVVKLQLLIQAASNYALCRHVALHQQICLLGYFNSFREFSGVGDNGRYRTPLKASYFFERLCSKECGDPRDLFYGSLSLTRLPLIPDYGKTPGEVALDAVHAFMLAERDKSTDYPSVALHKSVVKILKRMGITAGDKAFASKIQQRLQHIEHLERKAGSVAHWSEFEPSVQLLEDGVLRRLDLNASGHLFLNGSGIHEADADTLWRCRSPNSAENGTAVNPYCTSLASQSIFAGDGSLLGVTSVITRSGDFLLQDGSFDELEVERYLVLRPSDQRFRYEVVGQAATRPPVDSWDSVSDPENLGFLSFDLEPEDLIMYYVQSLVPPEWNYNDWILRCVATKFSGPSRVSYVDVHWREDEMEYSDSDDSE